MTTPKRIQLRRAKGWRLPANAVKVDRSTKWGNPFRADRPTPEMLAPGAPATAAECFRWWLDGRMFKGCEPERRRAILDSLGELRGRDLACWCRLGDHCHADVLLDVANIVTSPTMDKRAARAFAKLHAALGAEPVQAEGLPAIALSIRQPWAHAIICGGKDIENRAWERVPKSWRERRGRVAIHAARGMTRRKYEEARRFMESLGVEVPPAHELQRGGIIGSVRVVNLVGDADSPWFFGPLGLVLADPRPCEFIPSKGQLGYWPWKRGGEAPKPARWMYGARQLDLIEFLGTHTAPTVPTDAGEMVL